MIPVVSVEEMRRLDELSSDPEEVLIHRAAWGVSRAALRILGGAYGRRVVVIAGPGNNGADGIKAAEFLRHRGVRAQILKPGEVEVVPDCDLVIDAAFGTGFHGEYDAPDPNGALVLSVDIPSGVNGNTGVAREGAVWADFTVTFAALKPGHLLADGPERCGEIELVDIGIDTASCTMHLFEDSDLGWLLPRHGRHSHKWKSAVGVVAGSPGMMGAAQLVALGAQRAGAGMVRLLSPGLAADDNFAGEAVVMDGTVQSWSSEVSAISSRLHALVVGPGLGLSNETRSELRSLVVADELPLVVDADAITLLSDDEGRAALTARHNPVVLTPHEGEFARLTGNRPGADRIADVRKAAKALGCVVLLKGSTTVVADPDGEVVLTATGDARLATAGTGDVLSGVVGAFVARGLRPLHAAAAAAHVHGLAGKMSYSSGLIASDLPENVAALISQH